MGAGLTELPDDPARIADREYIVRQIPHDNAAGSDNGIVADAYARADHTGAAEPYVVANSDRLSTLKSCTSRSRVDRVQRSVDVDSRSDLSIVANANVVAIQENATVVDESVSTYVDVRTLVANER